MAAVRCEPTACRPVTAPSTCDAAGVLTMVKISMMLPAKAVLS